MTVEDVLNPPAGLGAAARPGRESMGVRERRHWSSFLRRDENDRALRAIKAPGKLGVAVFGPWGIGKTTLARSVELELAPTHHIIRLFGSAGGQTVPFGAFALQLARMPASSLLTPTSVMEGISGLILGDAASRPVLFVVDELPGLDSRSLGVMMHLLLSGTARLLVAAREPRQLPTDLAWLLKDGRLEAIALEEFTHEEVKLLIAQATGHFASEAAVSALLAASEGNPLVLEATFEEQARNGTLRIHRGGWVVCGDLVPAPDQALARLVSMRLAGQGAAVREGVQGLALIRKAPLDVVIKSLGQDAVAGMEEAGLLQIDGDGANDTCLRETYLGAVVRSQLGAARKAELHAGIASSAKLHAVMVRPPEVMALAEWALDAELPISSSYALVAAREANECLNPRLALRCAETIRRADPLWIHAVHAKAVAHLQLGDHQRAATEMEAADGMPERLLNTAEQAQWTLTRATVLLALPGGAGRIPALLANAGHKLSVAQAAGETDQHAAAQRSLRLAHCLLAVHQGEFAQLGDELAQGSLDDADPSFALDCASLLVPVLAATGRELEAVVLAQQTMRQAALRGRPLAFGSQCRQGLVAALLWSGRWGDCVDMVQEELQGGTPALATTSALRQLEMGMAQVFAGHGASAVQTLTAACAQLEVLPAGQSLAVAHSALALAHAQQGDAAGCARELTAATAAGEPLAWINRSLAEYFEGSARQWLDDPRAGAEMVASAQEDLARNRFGAATNLLLAGLLRGSEKDYAALESAAGQCQGPLARLALALARSARSRDPNLALSAAALAAEMGAPVLESRCTAMAVDFARINGDLVMARNAQQRFDSLKGSLPAVPVEPASAAVELTQRERQVAKLARHGMGNRDIAQQIGVSVRTIEGHLYQAYSKLGITTRSQLEQVTEL